MITEEVTTLGVGLPFRSLGRVFFLEPVVATGGTHPTTTSEVTFNDSGTPEIIDVVFTTDWSTI